MESEYRKGYVYIQDYLPGLLLKQKKATHFLIRRKAVTLREEGTLSETPIYLNLLRLVVVRGTVIVFSNSCRYLFGIKD